MAIPFTPKTPYGKAYLLLTLYGVAPSTAMALLFYFYHYNSKYDWLAIPLWFVFLPVFASDGISRIKQFEDRWESEPIEVCRKVHRLFTGLVLVGTTASGCWTALIFAVTYDTHAQRIGDQGVSFLIPAVGLLVGYGVPTVNELLTAWLARE